MSFSSLSMGQYVPADSLIHHLDPRAKLFSLLCLVSAVFASDTVLTLGLWMAVLGGLVSLSRLPWRAVLRSCRPIFLLAAFTFIFNAAALLWGERGSAFALAWGGFTALRLLVLMAFAVLLPLTTAPLELADALEELLQPLSRFGFPAHECALMVGMALRFIPLLMNETDRIMRAQLSRGARLDQGGLFRRVMAFFPVLIPLFVIIFRRADEMALAMEARGYGDGRGRTRRHPLRWRGADTGALLLCACTAGAFFMLRRR
ncbi:MAG: energy-coupling factor transporter transmembrane protein EcfT [Fretibacterium sp.]|nr:energy-coupling factor transporter transmembrane protein EcfT [Fretibacterium sp.]